MSLTDQIYVRKSVRKYSQAHVSDDITLMLASWREWVQPFRPRSSIDNHMRRLTSDKVRGLFVVKAPSFILYTSQHSPDYLINAGFILEQISLALTEAGVGSCYQGMAKATPEGLSALKQPPCIMLALGMSTEGITRQLDEFQRKPLAQIRSGDGYDELIEAMRLAPSGLNRQPWYFIAERGMIHAYVKGGSPSFTRLAHIDIGIALAHLYLVANEKGMRVRFRITPQSEKGPRGFNYVTTAMLD